MSVSKRKREILKQARALCPDATIEVTNGKHLKVTLTGPLGQRKVFGSMTPSDHREAKNMKRLLVQNAREVGCIPPRNKPADDHANDR